MIGPRYPAAVAMAACAHDKQIRKSTTIPYVSHPIAVSALVLQHGGDEDQAIIALLHDVVEDCGADWAKRISGHFGPRVYAGVIGCSDCSPDAGEAKAPWRERKESYLRHLMTASDDVLLVSACDKLHNLTCIVEDLEDLGPKMFERFRAGREGTMWYYESLVSVFASRLGSIRLTRQLRAMHHRMVALSA